MDVCRGEDGWRRRDPALGRSPCAPVFAVDHRLDRNDRIYFRAAFRSDAPRVARVASRGRERKTAHVLAPARAFARRILERTLEHRVRGCVAAFSRATVRATLGRGLDDDVGFPG